MNREDVERVLAQEVTPFLSSHGGGVELLEVSEAGKVKVRLTGACSGCPGARMTLESLVEKALKSNLPDVKEVEAVF